PAFFERGPCTFDVAGLAPARLRKPVALVAEPRVVHDRGLDAVEACCGDERPVQIAAPLAQAIDRMPSGEERIARAWHAQVRGKEHATEDRKCLDHGPQ